MENLQTGSVTTPVGPVRPTFLTVLCILTFIGSTWGIISNVRQYLTANTASALVSKAIEDSKTEIQKSGDEGSKTAESIMNSVNDALNPANLKKLAIYGGIASVLTLLGAFLMFQLKKNGFYIYVLGTLVGIVGTFMVFGGNLIGMITGSAMSFFGILFVILYGLNLKHLK